MSCSKSAWSSSRTSPAQKFRGVKEYVTLVKKDPPAIKPPETFIKK